VAFGWYIMHSRTIEAKAGAFDFVVAIFVTGGTID
jgi:hypothetical protein